MALAAVCGLGGNVLGNAPQKRQSGAAQSCRQVFSQQRVSNVFSLKLKVARGVCERRICVLELVQGRQKPRIVSPLPQSPPAGLLQGVKVTLYLAAALKFLTILVVMVNR